MPNTVISSRLMLSERLDFRMENNLRQVVHAFSNTYVGIAFQLMRYCYRGMRNSQLTLEASFVINASIYIHQPFFLSLLQESVSEVSRTWWVMGLIQPFRCISNKDKGGILAFKQWMQKVSDVLTRFSPWRFQSTVTLQDLLSLGAYIQQ